MGQGFRLTTMEPLTFLLYSITILVILNSIAIATTIWVAYNGSRVDEAKRQYWQQRLENLKSSGVAGIEDIK